jgi:hypothetical protein
LRGIFSPLAWWLAAVDENFRHFVISARRDLSTKEFVKMLPRAAGESGVSKFVRGRAFLTFGGRPGIL